MEALTLEQINQNLADWRVTLCRREGYGQYSARALVGTQSIAVPFNDSQIWDYFTDDSEPELYEWARRCIHRRILDFMESISTTKHKTL